MVEYNPTRVIPYPVNSFSKQFKKDGPHFNRIVGKHNDI